MPDSDLYAPFRPRRARTVSLVLAILLVIATIVLFAVVPTSGLFSFGPVDYAAAVAVVGGFLVFLWMQYTVTAIPSEKGIYVRNLVARHNVEWAEVLGVDFGDSAWARLDVIHDEPIAVMGIQRSDGEFAQAEARRLATLVHLHSGEEPVRRTH